MDFTGAEALIEAQDLTLQPPANEPARQYWYIRKCREHVKGLEQRLGRTPRALCVTFGCQMNARDSEKLRGILDAAGFARAEDEASADFVLYNTCTVRDNANQRLYGRLGALGGLKKQRPELRVALCGCMMQEQTAIEKIKKSYRFVDLIFGTYNLFRFAELLEATLAPENADRRMIIDVWREPAEIVEELPVARKYPFKSGVNIMFGCNNFCSYCIVPYVRGRERSRGAEDIIREVERLAADGVKEVMLLGQNVNSYGNDRREETSGDRAVVSFPALLREVCRVDGIGRVRFMTSHPKDLSDELIETIRTEPKVARHLHLALQSGSDRILRAMNRHYTKASFLALVEKLRAAVPDIALTTDLIVGFPGETAADVDETIDVVRRAAFDNAFTFIYSKRTGTPAAAMEKTASDAEIAENFNRLLAVVQETAAAQAGKHTGETVRVLTEEINAHDPSLLTGRTSGNTLVHFPGAPSLIGEFVDVTLTESHGFYYIGRMAD